LERIIVNPFEILLVDKKYIGHVLATRTSFLSMVVPHKVL
jgi:hypothetical protein